MKYSKDILLDVKELRENFNEIDHIYNKKANINNQILELINENQFNIDLIRSKTSHVIIKLNVGSEIFYCKPCVLLNQNHIFSNFILRNIHRMFGNKYENQYHDLELNYSMFFEENSSLVQSTKIIEIDLDRNPKHFNLILEFLENKTLDIQSLTYNAVRELLIESNYYNIFELSNLLKSYLETINTNFCTRINEYRYTATVSMDYKTDQLIKLEENNEVLFNLNKVSLLMSIKFEILSDTNFDIFSYFENKSIECSIENTILQYDLQNLTFHVIIKLDKPILTTCFSLKLLNKDITNISYKDIQENNYVKKKFINIRNIIVE